MKELVLTFQIALLHEILVVALKRSQLCSLKSNFRIVDALDRKGSLTGLKHITRLKWQTKSLQLQIIHSTHRDRCKSNYNYWKKAKNYNVSNTILITILITFQTQNQYVHDITEENNNKINGIPSWTHVWSNIGV